MTDKERRAQAYERYRTDKSKEAQDEMVLANIGLVHIAAKKFFGDMDDLVQTGTIGLIKAVKKYKYDSGCEFSTYAMLCIRGELIKSIRKKKLLCVSMEEELKHIDNKTSKIGEMIFCLDDCFEENIDMRLSFAEAIKSLSADERKMLYLYYGFANVKLSQGNIAVMFNMSQMQVSRQIRKAVEKLRQRIEVG